MIWCDVTLTETQTHLNLWTHSNAGTLLARKPQHKYERGRIDPGEWPEN